MVPRLIIISPHFPPTNAADHQRIRIALPFLLELGWKVTVVAVDPQDVASAQDAFLETTVPKEVQVVRVRANAGMMARLPGMGSLGYRATAPLARAVERSVRAAQAASESIVLYFSTTQFPVHRMIPSLRKKHRLKIVMDFQDPWANDYYRDHPEVRPPGGRWKFWVADQLARFDERRILPWVDGITAVSPAYAPALRRHYPILEKTPMITLPFGAAESDFSAVARLDLKQDFFRSDGRFQNWVYVGRGGADMYRALRPFFIELREASTRDPRWLNIRLHFIGTDYATGNRAQPSITPLALECGVAQFVQEYPQRIAYALALRCLMDADALLVPGSDDPSYTASKIYPYLLAEKPMLTIFHESSSVVDVMKRCRPESLVTFGAGDTTETIATKIKDMWFTVPQLYSAVKLDRNAFELFSARSMTYRLSDFLLSA